MEVIKPTLVRKDIYNILRRVVKNLSELEIPVDEDNSIVTILKKPYDQVRNMELLTPPKKRIYSMRINLQHRVVYTIDKKNKIVKIWSAWSYYENRVL